MYIHPSYPFKIDCSVVKSSKQRKNNRNQYWMVPQYNIKDSMYLFNKNTDTIRIIKNIFIKRIK